MADPQSTPPGDGEDQQRATAEDELDADGEGVTEDESTDGDAAVEALRQEVEAKYDFDDFGPADMAQMTAEEWEAAFDEESWITGPALLDRVADDLRSRVATREVFARIERHTEPDRVLAYSDEGYALVFPDGTVEGHGTVLRDVKPTVALCSMDDYDVPEPPSDAPLPEPDEIPDGGSELGNWMLQLIAGAQLLAGLVLLGGGGLTAAGAIGGAGASPVLLIVAGLAFLAIALVLFLVVANARLSDKFRSEEYRDRLRAVGLADGERPDFVPAIEADADGDGDEGRAQG
jgi:hypothetical protein